MTYQKIGYRYGEAQHCAKLKEDDIPVIRDEYERGRATMAALATHYRVSHVAIFKVVHRESWKHVE